MKRIAYILSVFIPLVAMRAFAEDEKALPTGTPDAVFCPSSHCVAYTCVGTRCKRATSQCWCSSPYQGTNFCQEFTIDCCDDQADKVSTSPGCYFARVLDTRKEVSWANLYVPTCAGGFIRASTTHWRPAL
jgi:hypothetical protein